MRTEQPKVIHLKDYQAPDYLIDKTHLKFELFEDHSLVHAELKLRRNPERGAGLPPLLLHGQQLELLALELDGQALGADDYQLDDEQLGVQPRQAEFVLRSTVRIHPESNTALEGLYKSGKMFCTQCEAEGFRKITYYLDRPDVMSRFTTTVSAEQQRYPVLLSNGNPVASGSEGNGRHWATWEDPFKKPAYLFALVAGDLWCVEDSFRTMSQRDVALRIYVEPENIDKVQHAMDSLKKSMRWDEEVYGREYDLDIFMIVAVNDFNMGAMENKGLNIFNSSCVLARAETATDAAHQRVEGVVAHEYFHNWSGNRVTCRDWFQLSLKEGFTVFRDSEFSADMNSRTVKRVEDVAFLRTNQFAEDAGPMAHPVRPDSFIEISNFYTLTVYEKGSEVVRMIHTLLGAEGFRKGSDLYFQRHDGQAVTCDDFVKAMEDANGVDLTQFKRWYSQSGTPRLAVEGEYDAAARRYTLTVRQSCPPTPGQPSKEPFVIPLELGLLDGQGHELPLRLEGEAAAQGGNRVLAVTEAEQRFVFVEVPEQPLPSLLRGFSAPVKLSFPYSRDQLLFLMQHDSDGFNRWEAGQQLSVQVLQELIGQHQRGAQLVLDPRLIEAYRTLLADEALDQAMVAEMLAAQRGLSHRDQRSRRCRRDPCRPRIRPPAYRRSAVRAVVAALPGQPQDFPRHRLPRRSLAHRPAQPAEYRAVLPVAVGPGGNPRRLPGAVRRLRQHDRAPDRPGGAGQFRLRGGEGQGPGHVRRLLQDDPLVMDQWFSVQAGSPLPGGLERVQALMQHPAFTLKNPNKVRALIGAFANQNLVNFHRPDGAGYRFLADQVIVLNALNPQIASRLLVPLTRWRKYDEARQALMRGELERILASGELSSDVYEVVSKSLA